MAEFTPSPSRPRVTVVFGTRPEAIKLAPVVHALRARPELETRVCVTGQHREMLDQVLAMAGIVPDHDLALLRPGQSLDALTAQLLTGLGAVFDREPPARVVVQGDTATAMTGALAAHYRRLPVAHVEAGLRSGDIYHPWPEEVNRRIVATIADLHFAPTETSAAALRRENVDPATIAVTGNTVVDQLLETRAALTDGRLRTDALDAALSPLKGRRIVLVTTHRRENLAAMQAIGAAVAAIAQRPDVAVVLPVHRNPVVEAALRGALDALPNVLLLPPQDYPHFVRLLDACHLVLTDSGGVQEEAPAFGRPVLVMRETTERPEGVAAGTARLVGTDPARIVAAVAALLDDPTAYAAMARAHNPFGDGRAAARIAAAIVAAHR